MSEEDFSKIPDEKKKPYSYDLWKRWGMLKMNPAERILMYELSQLNSCQVFLFGNDYPKWDAKDMAKFVKHIIPKILKEAKR